jgi:hypothetical protein
MFRRCIVSTYLLLVCGGAVVLAEETATVPLRVMLERTVPEDGAQGILRAVPVAVSAGAAAKTTEWPLPEGD